MMGLCLVAVAQIAMTKGRNGVRAKEKGFGDQGGVVMACSKGCYGILTNSQTTTLLSCVCKNKEMLR